MDRRGNAGGAGRAALVGVLTALSLTVLYLAALAPTGRLGLVALAGLVPAAAVVSSGLSAGAFCYAATGILGALLSPDKGSALLYLAFFGLYPLMKCLIERLRRLPLEWGCKLALFNGVFTACWFLLHDALLSGLPAVFEQLWAFYLLGNLAFVVYDLGFSRLIAFYAARVDKTVRRKN